MHNRAGAASLAAVFFLTTASAAGAATFQLKSGRIVEGDVKRESDDFYVVRTADGSEDIVLKSKIVSMEGVQEAPPPAVEAAPVEEAPIEEAPVEEAPVEVHSESVSEPPVEPRAEIELPAPAGPLRTQATPEQREEFERLLLAFVKQSPSVPFPVGPGKPEEAFDELVRFADANPESIYASDVEFFRLLNLWSLNEATPEPFEALAARGPAGVSRLTKEILGQLPGLGTPFALWAIHVRGMNAWSKEKDFAKAERNFTEFLDRLDYADPAQKADALGVCALLVDTYRQLGDRHSFDKTKARGQELFPEQADSFEKITFE